LRRCRLAALEIAMRSEQDMIAYALEIDPALLPFVPELLADLDELGSDTELIVEAVQALQLPKSARVIDLGCGKGATSIAIAQTLGLEVVGVDLFAPFIELCRERAREAGVAHRCTFRRANILELGGKTEPADVAIFAALGDVLGPLDATIGVIRHLVKPGGYMIIADDFLARQAPTSLPSYDEYVSHEETLRRLESHGDTIAREIIEQDTEEEDEGALIRRRALTLAEKHPELADAFRQFADDQERAYAYIAEHLVAAIWVVRRAAA
jgi:cyclopropane fatty-acyl-phospholipid synthase-like methyltransferase